MPPPILHVIYAGRGDCLILECDDQGNPAARQFILVDGGPRNYYYGDNMPEAPYYRYVEYAINRLLPGQALNKVIITHPDEDHYGGFMHLANNLAINNQLPPDLCLFTPRDKFLGEGASTELLQILNNTQGLVFQDTVPPDGPWLFPGLKAIFPGPTAIQYCYVAANTPQQRHGGQGHITYNTNLDNNPRSIIMYTWDQVALQQGVNQMPIFLTGDGNSTAIAGYMRAEFPGGIPQLSIYKIQHHGSLPDNQIKNRNRLHYTEGVILEAFVLGLCRLMFRPAPPGTGPIIPLAVNAARQYLTNWYNGTHQQYYDAMKNRQRAVQAFIQAQAFRVPQNPGGDKIDVFRLNGGLVPDPVTGLYAALDQHFAGQYRDGWTAFRTECFNRYGLWERVNEVREFYTRFQADCYVVSANHTNYGHPKPEVLLGLALAVEGQQPRRARLYVTSGYSVQIAEIQKLIDDLELAQTADHLFCGNHLTIRYLSIGPYMSLDGSANHWNTAQNARDISKVTRQVIFQAADINYRNDLRERLEDEGNQGPNHGDPSRRRMATCKIRVLATGQEVYPTFANGNLYWHITPGAGPSPNYFFMNLDDVPAHGNPGQVSNFPIFADEHDPTPYHFRCLYSETDLNQNVLWYWSDSGGNWSVVPHATNPNAADLGAAPANPGQLPDAVRVVVERHIDAGLMMMELDPMIPEPMGSQPDIIASTPSLQQVLQDIHSPFIGVDTVDLLALLKFLFDDDILLKQALNDMPQMILHAGFLDLDVSLPASTVVSAMVPVIGKVIASTTLACQTKPTSTIKWPAQLKIADLTLSLDNITVSVKNCGKKQVAMSVESSVSMSSASTSTTLLQLGMAWSSSGSVSDTGPIISFKAGLGDLSELIKALGGVEDDIKGILGGEIPFTSDKSAGSVPTIEKPSAPPTEIGFSICQPVQATSEYNIYSIWIKTKISGWSAYLPVPAKFDKIVAEAAIEVFHPFQSAQRAVGGSIDIKIPIPPPPSDPEKDNGGDLGGKQPPRNLSASLTAIPYPGPGGTRYDYRFRILEQVDGVNLQDLARVAHEYFDVPDFTKGVAGALPGLTKVVEMIRVRELSFGVGKTKASGWSFNEWVVDLSVPSFELLPGVVSLVDSRVMVQRYYEDGVSAKGEAVFMVQSGEVNKQAIVAFATPTMVIEGYISFKAPGGFNLADIFNAFDLGDVSQVPVLSDIATIDILSTEVKFVRPKTGGTSISSASAQLRKTELELGVLTFQNLELTLKWQRVQPADKKPSEGQLVGKDPSGQATPSSFVTLDFSTFIPSINSSVQITYDGQDKVMKGSLTSVFDSAASLGQILQAPVPGSGKDTVSGSATGSFLTAYFDRDSVDALAKILDAVKIRSYSIEYGKTADGPKFMLAGVLGLGPLDLSLTLSVGSVKDDKKPTPSQDRDKPAKDNQSNSQQTWEFRAKLSMPTGSAATPPPPDVVKLGDLLGGLIGDDVKDSLPPFVANIEFSRPKSDNELSLSVQKVLPDPAAAKGTPPPPAHIVFCIKVSILGFSFSYTQCQECVDTKAPPGNAKPAPKPTKRILSASLDAVPDIKIPLIGDVPKPVDQILYLWVQDTGANESAAKKPSGAAPQTEKKETLRGLTSGEVNAINTVLVSSNMARLVFKQTQDKLEDNTVVLAAGHHFMMTGKDSLGNTTVILDYVFGQNTTPKAQPKKAIQGKDGKPADPTPSPAEKGADSKAPGLAPYKKEAGPLSISNIGFGWKGTPKEGGRLSISLDASVTIGPISFGVIGLKLEFPITSQTSIRNLPTPEVSIDGLAASFNKPPLIISGAFLHKVVNGDDIYAGALLIGYSVYLFQAVGFYGDMTDPRTGKKFPSAFMFCRFEGTLMSVGWAELSGLVAGLGYNSSIAFPEEADKVPSFPLIAPPPTSPDPMAVLEMFMDPTNPSGGIISPKLDSFWIAAGVKITAFQVLQVTAILVLSFDPHLKIGIFALAVADLPPAPPGSGPGKFVHVELAMAATLDTSLGILKIMGGLTPNSYLLDPNCHLTGGFAMYSWFDSPDPALKGDWVFTIGGYHRSFIVPAHYPPPETVPRLGISWAFSSNISITGEAYFAITPKMCMAGGRLDVTLRAGPLKAWFNAYADFLINYKPFHFIAEGGVSVGVECKVDFCIVSITVRATLGATLYLEGPPIRGTVTVKFWVMEFGVNFGKKPDALEDVDIGKFFELVMQGGSSGGGNMLAAAAAGQNGGGGGGGGGEKDLHVFSCQSGLIPTVGGEKEDVDKKKEKPWVVRGAAFAFNVASLFAIAECTVISAVKRDEVATEKNSEKRSWGQGGEAKPHAKPMKGTSPLYSEVEIRIYREIPVPREEDGGTTVMALGDDSDIPLDDGTDSWTKVQRVVRPLSSAIWGRYDSATDPSRPGADHKGMLSSSTSGTVNLMTGVDIHGPDAKLSAESAIEFNVAEAMGLNATEPDPIPTFPNTNPPPVDEDKLLIPMPPSEKWQDDAGKIKEGWKGKEAVAGSVLDMWTGKIAAFSQWDFGADGAAKLQAKAPGEIIGRFDELYLDIPWMTTEVA